MEENATPEIKLVKKEVKYYYKHREDILAKKKAQREEKLKNNPEYIAKCQERQRKREEKEREFEKRKEEREAKRNTKRTAILSAKTGTPLILPDAEKTPK